MKELKDNFIQLYRTERGAFTLMALNFLLSVAIIVCVIVNLNFNSVVIKVGYGDIGGYRDGSWIDIVVYVLFAILFGVLHSFLALKIFKKRGGAMAKFFLLTTTMLILGTFIILTRILRES